MSGSPGPAAGICGQDWVIESGADVIEVAELQYSKATSNPARWVSGIRGIDWRAAVSADDGLRHKRRRWHANRALRHPPLRSSLSLRIATSIARLTWQAQSLHQSSSTQPSNTSRTETSRWVQQEGGGRQLQQHAEVLMKGDNSWQQVETRASQNSLNCLTVNFTGVSALSVPP